jgi:hypothetical protein
VCGNFNRCLLLGRQACEQSVSLRPSEAVVMRGTKDALPPAKSGARHLPTFHRALRLRLRLALRLRCSPRAPPGRRITDYDIVSP